MSEVAVDVDGGIAEDVLNDDVGDELVAAARDDGGSSGPMEDEDVVVHGENDVDLADDDDDDVLVTSETQDTPPKPPNAFDRLVSGTQATNTGRKGGAAGDGTASIDVALPDLRPDGGGAKNDHAKNQNGSVSSHRLPPPDDALACSVCLEPCSVHGAHQVTSLKCGHVFGFDCIKTWLTRKKKGNGGKCPQCNEKACLKDLRKLFVPSFHAFVDTDEVEALSARLKEKEASVINAETTAISVSRRLVKLEAELKDAIAKTQSLTEDLKSATQKLAYLERKAPSDEIELAICFRQSKRQRAETETETEQNVPRADRDELWKQTRDEKEKENSLRSLYEPGGTKKIGFGAVEDVDEPREDSVTLKKRRAFEQRETHLKNGKFVPRASTQTHGAKSFDVNANIAAIGERADSLFAAQSFLTKLSLRNVSSKIRIPLPNGSGNVRDVHLSNASTSGLVTQQGDDRVLALCCTLGKKLIVCDLQRDHLVCKVDLPHQAWSCAWGGWSTVSDGDVGGNPGTVHLPGGDFQLAPSAASDFTTDPSSNQNLVTVGTANGEVLMYDLRNVKTCVSRIAPPLGSFPGGQVERKPVHTVIPVPKTLGGGVLFCNLNGARYFRHGTNREGETNQFQFTSSQAAAAVSRLDGDKCGVVSAVPALGTCEASLAWCASSKTLVGTTKDLPQSIRGTATHKVVREWRATGFHGSKKEPHTSPCSVRLTEPFLWACKDSKALPRATTRVCLTSPGGKTLPGLIACGAPCENGAPAHVVLTDSLSGNAVSAHAHCGSGEIEDVRGWHGHFGGRQVEVLASLSADAVTVFSWDRGDDQR